MHDDKLELKLISQLMDQLQGEMEYDEDDFASRLGRKKPGVEVLKVEGSMPMGGKSMEDAMEDMNGDMEMDENPTRDSMVMDEIQDDEMDPEKMLKKRLMKLRA